MLTLDRRDCLRRLAYAFGIRGAGRETMLRPALPFAAAGLPVHGTPNTQTISTGLLAPFLNLQQTQAELAAGVTPTNCGFEPWRGEDVRRIGASGNGRTDDRLALFNANSIGTNLYFAPGTYRVASNLTLTVPCSFDSGAILKPDAGVTITVNAPINAGPWQIFNLSNAGSVLNGAVRVPAVYPEWFGADPTGVRASDFAVERAVALVQSSGGGVVQFLAGGSYLFAGGNVFNITKPIKFLGSGTGASFSVGGTRFTHTGNNICFNFQAGLSLLAAVTLEGFNVIGPTTGKSAIFASFSDSYGNTIRRCVIENYQEGGSIQLWNRVRWTEGFIIEDSNFRLFGFGVNFKRTSSSGGAESFFGFTTRNFCIVPGRNGAGLLLNSTATNNLVLYAANIDIRTSIIAGGTRVFFVGGYSVFAQSTCTISQDGTPNVLGTDGYTFFQNSPGGRNDPNGGYINVDAKFKAQDIYSTSQLGATANVHLQNNLVFSTQQGGRSAVAGYIGLPNARVRGATIMVGDTNQTINKTFTFTGMQPGTRYRAHLHMFAVGGASIVEATYEICHFDEGLISPVTRVSGSDTAAVQCRTVGGAAALSAGTGNSFELMLNAATVGVSCSYTLELEML